jgi:hypothetical protein
MVGIAKFLIEYRYRKNKYSQLVDSSPTKDCSLPTPYTPPTRSAERESSGHQDGFQVIDLCGFGRMTLDLDVTILGRCERSPNSAHGNPSRSGRLVISTRTLPVLETCRIRRADYAVTEHS